MKRLASQFAIVALTALLVVACATTPGGRRQLLLVGGDQMSELGATAFASLVKQKPLSRDARARRRVECVSDALVAALPQPWRQQPWEVRVFADDTPNAFALPGGKIGVNSGMLKVARTDDQLAAVLAHEVGHVVARHPSEQMSQSAAIQTALGAAGVGDEAVGQLVQMATGVGQLSFSRSAEAEADRIGLEYMARAGYNPEEAITLWQNMEAATAEAGQPPEFLSTHPNPEHRIENIRAALPEVMPVYRANS